MRAPEAAGLHRYLTQNRMNAYTVLVDLMANAQLGEKTMLYMLDAIICAPGESVSITGENSRWQQAPFNGDYTSSVFVSQDPVAIDSVGADFLINEPTVTSRNSALRDNPNVENYLHEAGLVANAPSGTEYRNGSGSRVTNLGVHEHWNNATEKQYSRNLGKSQGIELVRIGVPNPGAGLPGSGTGSAGSAGSGSGTGSTGTTGADSGASGSGSANNAAGTQSGFIDVLPNAWYAEAVEYCRKEGLMRGTSATTFDPEGITTRAMLVTILYNKAGSPAAASKRENSFTDIPMGTWYSEAVQWAAASGIVSGYEDGRFGPDDPVTRQQTATILWQHSGKPTPGGNAESFVDGDEISAYAINGVAWAREAGIISGKEGNRFDPKSRITRAETAAMLYKYFNVNH